MEVLNIMNIFWGLWEEDRKSWEWPSKVFNPIQSEHQEQLVYSVDCKKWPWIVTFPICMPLCRDMLKFFWSRDGNFVFSFFFSFPLFISKLDHVAWFGPWMLTNVTQVETWQRVHSVHAWKLESSVQTKLN